MVKSRKTGIRRSIEALLIPAFEARGFKRVPDPPNDARAQTNPWGRFIRHDPSGMAIIEIQFNKNRLSHFRLNLALATPGLEDKRAGSVQPNYCLTRWGLPLRRWFGVRKTAREGITDAEYDAVVMQVIHCLPQIDRLFATGKRSWRMAEMPEPRWVALVMLGFWGFVGMTILSVLWIAWIELLRLLVRLFRG